MGWGLSTWVEATTCKELYTYTGVLMQTRHITGYSWIPGTETSQWSFHRQSPSRALGCHAGKCIHMITVIKKIYSSETWIAIYKWYSLCIDLFCKPHRTLYTVHALSPDWWGCAEGSVDHIHQVRARLISCYGFTTITKVSKALLSWATKICLILDFVLYKPCLNQTQE